MFHLSAGFDSVVAKGVRAPHPSKDKVLELDRRLVKVPVGDPVSAQQFAQSSFLQVSRQHCAKCQLGSGGKSGRWWAPRAMAAACAHHDLCSSQQKQKDAPAGQQEIDPWVPMCTATASTKLVPAGEAAAGESLLMCSWPVGRPRGIPSACRQFALSSSLPWVKDMDRWQQTLRQCHMQQLVHSLFLPVGR